MAKRKNIFLLLLLMLLSSPVYSQNLNHIVLSEVMFRPSETNGEFVELFNSSVSDTADLSGLQFKYYTSNEDKFVEFIGGIKLPPGGFALLIESDYDFENGILKNKIPQAALIMKTADNSFGSSGMANSTDRKISLLNSEGELIDEYTYSADNDAGISDEKIVLNNDNSKSNWSNSLTRDGTPGYKNSVSPKLIDAGITEFIVSEKYGVDSKPVKAKIVIANNGAEMPDSMHLIVFNDLNNDSAAAPSEILFDSPIIKTDPGETRTIEFEFDNYITGINLLIARLDCPGDEFLPDNEMSAVLTGVKTNEKRGDVIVNEIMYAPENSQTEWIEIFNRSSLQIELHNYKIADENDTSTVITEYLTFSPGEYFVIAKDSSILSYYNIDSNLIINPFPALNNSGDMLMLLDSLNRVIDSLNYKSAWGRSGGYSLERIEPGGASADSLNWNGSVSKEKGTPGRKNSVTPKDNDMAITEFGINQKYGFDGKPVGAYIIIMNKGKYETTDYNISIFLDENSDSLAQAGEKFTELNPVAVAAGESAEINFPIADYNEGNNSFIAVINFKLDEFTGNNFGFARFTGVKTNENPGDIVINEIMYSPKTPEPEWIEFFNVSGKTINLSGYGIADEKDTNTIFQNDFFVNPGEYLVVTRDSILTSLYGIPGKLVAADFPPLGNSGDKIIFSDKYGRTIDSVFYSSDWGGASGISLEKIFPETNSNDSSNWSSSKYSGTPGKINSVSQKLYDIAVFDIAVSPHLPYAGDSVSVSALIKNTGKYTADFLIRFGIKESGGKDVLLEEKGLELDAGDSTVYFFKNEMNAVTEKLLFVEIIYEADQDTSNNSMTKIVKPSYKPGSIILNEIMFDPVNGEPEWFEIYNSSAYAIDLNDWSVSDIFTTPVKKNLPLTEFYFMPGSFLVVSKDSSITQFYRNIPSKILTLNFANLNNDRDGLVLRDFRGEAVDSVLYINESAVYKGKSYERISYSAASTLASNWRISYTNENGTPGRINSVTPKNYDLELSGIISDPEYPAENNKVAVSVKIINRGIMNAEDFSVLFKIIENNSDEISESVNGLFVYADDSLTVDMPGLFVLTGPADVECLVLFKNDEDTVNNYFEKTIVPGAEVSSVLINEIMYDPLPGCSEWIEIQNVSDTPVNLKGWTISDELPLPAGGLISADDLFLDPDDFAVITNDTSSFNYAKDKVLIGVNFGKLGNSSDGIMLRDFRNAEIDKLHYNSSWGGNDGYSLERISRDFHTGDSSNWHSSLSTLKATPGAVNSFAEIPAYNFNSVIINEIMFEPGAGNCEFVEIYNRSPESVNIGGWKFRSGGKSSFHVSDTSFALQAREYFLLAADSSVFDFYNLNPGSVNIIVAGNSSLDLPNSGGVVYLTDFRGNVIDSVFYDAGMHNSNYSVTKNISLERINPDINSNDAANWSSSVNPAGATPLRINSVYVKEIPSETEVSVSPNPFSPDNDGFEDFAIIKFNLTEKISNIRIKVFDSSGRLVRMVVNDLPSGPVNSVIFDGLDDNKKPLRMGIYILFIEAAGESGGNVSVMKIPVVIARKL